WGAGTPKPRYRLIAGQPVPPVGRDTDLRQRDLAVAGFVQRRNIVKIRFERWTEHIALHLIDIPVVHNRSEAVFGKPKRAIILDRAVKHCQWYSLLGQHAQAIAEQRRPVASALLLHRQLQRPDPPSLQSRRAQP